MREIEHFISFFACGLVLAALAAAIWLSGCAFETELPEPEATPYQAELNGLPINPCTHSARRCVRIPNRELNTDTGSDPSTTAVSINALRAAITLQSRNQLPRFGCYGAQPPGTAICRDETTPDFRYSRILSTVTEGVCTRKAETHHTDGFSMFRYYTKYCSPDRYRFTFYQCSGEYRQPAAEWPDVGQGAHPYLNVCWGD